MILPEPDNVADPTADPINLTSLSSLTSLCSVPTSPPQSYPYHGKRRLPSAVTIKDNIVVLNVNSNRARVSHGFLARLFGVLDSFGIVVDLISTSEVHVSMAIEGMSEGEGGSGDSAKCGAGGKKVLDRLVAELQKCGTASLSFIVQSQVVLITLPQVTVHPHMSILSLVGKHMRNMIGISGRMFTTLAQGGVNIEMISQGASEVNISCVIQTRDAVKALNMIHQSCLGLGVNGPAIGGEQVGEGVNGYTGVGRGGVRGVDGRGGRGW